MAGIALSRLKITPQEFYDITPAEFYYAVKDHSEGEEAMVKANFEAIRTQTAFFVNTQVKKQYKKPEKMWPLPWDRERKEQSVDEMKQALYAIASAFKSKK